jgi:uncharacterized protein YutE (UPF0331/DUF86 family)
MIDKEKIESLFNELDKYLKELSELSSLPVSEYLNNSRNVYSGRYLLQIAVETCINIGNHIISRQELGVPKEYADTFRILQSNDIISQQLLETLVLMTRFRNRVVHLYWDIDDKLVLEIIKNNYKDFTRFRTAVLKYLKSLT